jgi:photosystem II stability/assembly factor-like uncharacterized protein
MNWLHFPEPKSAFALSPLQGGACLAATEAGLWRFTPAAGCWQPVAPQIAHVSLTAVATDGDLWLVGSNGDIARSTDAGETWQLAHLPVKARVLGIALSPAFAHDGIALAATAEDGVLRSADQGITWHAWNYGLLDLAINAIAFSPNFGEDETCFAASDYAVFISVNGGRAWQELPLPAWTGPFAALDVTADGQLYVGTEGHGLWTAAPPYVDWQQVTALPADEVNFVQAGWAATTAGVFAARAGAWQVALDRSDVLCLSLLDDGTLVAATADSGLWHAQNKEP